jgi:predicted PurR-regulated permease PerM
MLKERIYTTLSIAIIFILLYLLYRMLYPFLTTIAWAMVLSITFYPLYKGLLRFLKRPWLSSLLTLLFILILVIGPFTYIVGSLIKETTDLYITIEKKGFEAIAEIQRHPRIEGIFERIRLYKMFEDFDIQEEVVTTLKGIGKYIAQNFSNLFRNAIMLVVNFVIMCFTIFYFLKDGNSLANYIKTLLPFTEIQKERLERRVKEMVVAAIYGGVAVGIAQGTLGGIAFYAFGISSPVFWGTTMAFFSLVPVFGTFLIWGPAGLILILSGEYVKGIGLLLYGAIIISSVDNIIKPMVIGERTKMHILLVFFSVLGGIRFFGFLGFILGPLITALCLSLLEMHRYEEAP